MKIILMRHGKPILTREDRVSPGEMAGWIEHYDLSVVESGRVPASSLELAQSATLIVTSTAARALSSAQVLGCTPSLSEALFCEAQLPVAPWPFPRLSPFTWAAFFRLLWFCGYARGAESFQAAKARAGTAARRLASLASAGQGPVLLVGHGIMNRLIAKELVSSGWVALSTQPGRYWGASVYRLHP